MSISVGAPASASGIDLRIDQRQRTSAMPVGLRSRVPAKKTSSIREPRRVLADCSPSTQEIASAMLDFPHPLGSEDDRPRCRPVKLEFGAVAEKDLEAENLKPFQFEQCLLLEKQWPVISALALAASLVRRFAGGVYQTGSRLPRAMHGSTFADQFSPRLERVGTNLSYCNGEIGAGSSNITLYVVWPCVSPRWVAHALRHLPGLPGEEDEVGEAGEQDKL